MNGSQSGGLLEPSLAPEKFQSPVHNVRMPYPADGAPGYSVASIVTSGSGGTSGFHQNLNFSIDGGGGGGGQVVKKKRGRPRKDAANGPMSTLPKVVKSTPVNMTAAMNGGFEAQQAQAQVQSAAPAIAAAPVSSFPMEEGFAFPKKVRGRPRGSSNKKHKRESMGSAGFGFTPHIITVQPGEDVLNKIMSFSQNGSRAVCIMSAIGVISNVTFRQAATSGGTATYEGRFDIVAISGSYVLSEVYGQRTRTGGLSVTLSGQDRGVFGGVVAGLLIAASPVQVIVGSFLPENSKEAGNVVEPLNVGGKVTGGSSSASHGTASESSGGRGGSPLIHRANEASPRGMASMPWK